MFPTAVESYHASSSTGAANRVSPSRLAHVVFRTTTANYETMVEFYQNLLSAEIVHRTPVLTFLRYDEEHHRVAIIQMPDTTPQPTIKSYAGLDHIAFTYANLTQLAQQYTHLKSMAKPILPLWCVNHGPTTSFYYRDPDGSKIELQVDNFDTSEDANDFMKGSLYGQNPMGTDFDADEWAAGILSKATKNGDEGLTQIEVRELKTRREIGERQSLPEGF